MDPIHPIVPVQPRLPPIAPTPLIGGIGPEDRRRDADAGKRRRRRPDPATPVSDEREGEDDSGLHINVTA